MTKPQRPWDAKMAEIWKNLLRIKSL